MAKSTIDLETPLREQLDRLAAFEPADAPVISLYLDMRTDQQGQRNHVPFLRKVWPERAAALSGKARASFERDGERINRYLEGDAVRSVNGLAIFACSACNDFFEAVTLPASAGPHWLSIGSVPHLYPLARLNDQYPRYAALLVDTNSARLFVFGLGLTEAHQRVDNVKTRKTSTGGWSQARYQRHLENFHLHHMKEVAGVLDRVVRDESISRIVLACDEVARPALLEQLPKQLAEKVVDVINLDINTPEHRVLAETLEALREKDAASDAERVERMLGAWRAGGLAVAGAERTLQALVMGQVEELLIAASPASLDRSARLPTDAAPGTVKFDTAAPDTALDSGHLKLADELIAKAQQTSARIRFIEDPALLSNVGGVGALLRFNV